MRLWELKPKRSAWTSTNNPWVSQWDCYHRFIIRAETAEDARKLVNTSGCETSEVYNQWLDKNMTSCVTLENDGKAGVVLAHFMTG